MTETTTPTEEVVAPTGSQEDLPVEQTNDSAVEQVQDTASEATSDTDSKHSTTDGEDEPKLDADLKRFAKGQGYSDEELETLSPTTIKLLSRQRNKVVEERKQIEKQNRDGIEKAVDSVDKKTDMPDREYFDFRMKQRDIIDDVREYWRSHEDDRQYEAEAVAILQQEKELYGEAAMIRLAENMPRLIREAKFAAGANDTEKATEQGRKEERERLNKLQSGAADGISATVTETTSKNEVTMDWIRTEYDPSNKEHREKLDKFMASGGKIY